MNEKEYVKIHIFDLMFLIEKASFFIRDHKNKEYSMKLWEDRIEEIKEKCNFIDLIREIGDNYNYELRYLKDILYKIYRKHSEITLEQAFNLLVKEICVPTHILPVKTDVYYMTITMIDDGEINGEIIYKDGFETFQRKI